MMNALFCQSLQLQATPHYFLFLSLLSQSLLSYLKYVLLCDVYVLCLSVCADWWSSGYFMVLWILSSGLGLSLMRLP